MKQVSNVIAIRRQGGGMRQFVRLTGRDAECDGAPRPSAIMQALVP